MFKHKTLFIVGAGASSEVKMPVGSKLKTQIADLVNIEFKDGHNQSAGDYQIKETLAELLRGRGERNINPLLHKGWAMSKALRTSAESIDNYLYNHSNDLDVTLIGKLGIAKAILNAEAASTLASPQRSSDYYMEGRFDPGPVNDTWFMRLAELLINHRKVEDVEKVFDNVDFITFNYDRTIERFFPQVIGAHYGVTEGEIATLLDKREIIHPYGSLGRLNGNHQVPYGAARSNDLGRVASNLRTFDEGVKDEAMLQRMTQLFAEAHTIIFLGFAFHEQNMELLNPGVACDVERIFATTYGLTSTTVGTITNELAAMIQTSWAGVTYVQGDMEARVLMRDNQRAMRN